MTAPHEIQPQTHALPGVVAAIPELRTDRLVLRAPQLSDFPTLIDIDFSVAETSRRGERSREDSWYEFTQMSATWIWRGHGWWTVCDNQGAAGFVGLGFEPGDQAPELGYLFLPRARGLGYATEAATAARDFARDTLKLPALVSYISDTNDASRNVARKLGAARDSDAEAALRAVGEEGVQVWRHWGQIT